MDMKKFLRPRTIFALVVVTMHSRSWGAFHTLSVVINRNKQRVIALFLVALLSFGVICPPVAVFAAVRGTGPTAADIAAKNPHKTSITPSIGKINMSSPPAPTTGLQSNIPAAADAIRSTANGAAFFGALKGKVNNEALSNPTIPKRDIQPHELTDKRRATSSQFQNKDGSITQTNYFSPHFYQNNGSWDTIDTTLITDTNAADSGKALSAIEPLISSPNAYIEKANSWQARFTPSDFSGGMIRIEQNGSQVGFSPVNANTVNPTITTDTSGKQTVHYANLWNGVDVEYVVESDQVEEAIILKDKSAASQVQFKLIGAHLQKSTGADASTAFGITGALGDQFGIAPAHLILNTFGFIEDKTSSLVQSYSNGIYTVGISSAYFQQLSAKAFPAVIDPSVVSMFGTRAGGNYISFKSDGYICPDTTCDLYAGSLYDSSNILRYWRGAFFSPYDFLKPSGTVLDSAVLHLTQLTGVSWWTGTTATHNFQVGHATCLTGFNCVDGVWASASFATSGDIDVTNLYQNRLAAGDYGAWLMVMGEDNTTSSFKSFNPDYSYVTFTYHSSLPAPTFAQPSTNGQLFTDPQASFKLNDESNPNNGTPLQYEMLISDGSNGGTVIDGGMQNGTLWTVPDGVLQDGSTYFIQAHSYDPSLNIYSPWTSPISFKVDSRRGKDKTQTYDTLGPVNVDLATGNVSTSISSHTTKALAGSLGVNLDYNSPLKSRQGLVGQYYNYLVSSTVPVLTRVDQNVNFAWGTGGSPGSQVSSSNFTIEWNGYFVTPVTGTYYFGYADDRPALMDATVNGHFIGGSGVNCTPPICYDTTGITLTAGQVVPVNVEMIQTQAGVDNSAYFYVKGAVSEQIVPKEWLQTGVRMVQANNGLAGHYYSYADTGVPPTIGSSNNTLFLTRTDPLISFNWNSSSPIPNGPVSNFLVRWTGYITVPVTGSYTFGTQSDDGSIVTINNQQVYSKWRDGADASPQFGSALSLNAGTYPITVDYYQHLSGDTMSLYVMPPGGPTQIVPSSWLAPQTQVLPAGWGLGIDPDGNATYTHLTPNQNNAVLTDSSGDTHDYTWTGSGYKPPVNEYGYLVRNNDGSFTLQDADGKTYVFDTTGTLVSLTNPLDDRQPAALQYTYGPINGTGPSAIQQITDSVNTNRWARVYYGGAAQCGTSPSGFVSAPANMVCALITNDGRTTYFYYRLYNGTYANLARVARPGNDNTDYQYQAVLNSDKQVIGYQLVGVRDSLANDAIVAGVRANDSSTLTQIGYDALGRAVSVTAPAATAGATRIKRTIQYLPGTLGYQNGNPSTGYFGVTKEHVTGAHEPHGYSLRVEYDNLFRTTTSTDVQGLSTITQWDSVKDLQYATTSPTGLMTTTVYDDDDRPISQYGPAPAAWFASTPNASTGHIDIVPQPTYASQIARTDTVYDQGMAGLAVAYMAVGYTGANTASLAGAPRLHSTNIASDGTINHTWGSTSPIPNYSGNWGFNMTGTMRLPTAGNWTFSTTSDEGIRIWIDDSLILDNWKDNTSGNATVTQTVTYNNKIANALHRVRIDYYHLTSISNAIFSLAMTPPGGAQTTAVASYFMPDYSLQTSTTSYDGTYGNTTATMSYGSTPELGLDTGSTVDPSDLNLSVSKSYETPGTGYLRQTSQTSPGGSTSTLSYYSATDTDANPCISGSPAALQAGFLKTVTNPSPDNGTTPGRTITFVYDDAGNVVAAQTNTDGWICKKYDARERLIEEDIPASNGQAARTVTYNYNVGGNPLTTSTTDSTGTITTTIDLLDRTGSYTDVDANTTTTVYDNLGRLQSQTSPMGTKSFAYDSYNRLIDEKLDGIDLAQSIYDKYGRLAAVTYPSAGTLEETVTYDSTTGVQKTAKYTLSDSTVVTDTVTRTQSGRIRTDKLSSGVSSLASTYTYDLADRLSNAKIGSNTYSYSFGTQSTTCAAGTNPNAGKNSNRTSQTINGVTTTYCYDYADQLVSSSDPASNAAQYDSHGNIKLLGSNSTPLHLFYDSADRNWGIEQYDGSSGNGNALYYSRDAQGRITYRELDKISAWNWSLAGAYDYGYTGSSSSPSFIRNHATWAIIEEYVSLPGGILLTIPGNNTQTSNYSYSLPNIHGDTILTVNSAGNNISTGTGPSNSYVYDPFGNPLPGGTNPNDTIANDSFGWEGSHRKITENAITLNPVQMGERVYLPTLARFTTVDPIPGGNANAYVYALDPINFSDLNGMFSCMLQCTADASYFQPTTTVAVIQSPTAIPTVRITLPAASPAKSLQVTTQAKLLLAPSLKVLNNGPANPPAQTSPLGNERISIIGQAKAIGGAAVGGCIGSASLMLAVAGSATLITGGAAALPGAGAVGWSCATGAVGGAIVYWLDPPYDLSPMGDINDGLDGLRGL